MRARAPVWRHVLSLSHCPISMNKKENQMAKAGQAVGQARDTVGQPLQPGDPWYVRPGVPAWAPRDDDKRALLVSDRSAVFDRPLPALAKQEAEPEITTAMGPMPTQWTWDLVHCRLLSVHAMALRLARAHVPAGYRSFLGSLQPQEATMRHRPLTDDDTKRFDWTMSRIDAWSEIDRVVIKGVMSGFSLSEVSKATYGVANRFGGYGLKKPSVFKRYRTNTTIMAAEWIDLRQPIDSDTRECWLNRAAHKK